tara:strand:+ start:608 stop:2332 length:1725 start_codon:yes stop_codon:yes gene_type:complete
MCSIEGTTDKSVDIEKFTHFNKNRGPDGTNHFKDDWIQLGHNYLAISPNKENKIQPYVSPKGNILVFNGEIYGLPEGTFDTQWLAEYLDEHGVGGLKYTVNGMWAFAWYEPDKHRITLCRDHFGQKPLYLYHDGNNLSFSSTCRPLIALQERLYGDGQDRIDRDGLQFWDACSRFAYSSITHWHRIRRVVPGQVIEYDLKSMKIINEDTLWGNDERRFSLHPNHQWDEIELAQKFEKAFNEVCNAPGINKTISLSGGLDSTLIASIAKKQDNLSCTTMKWVGKEDETGNPDLGSQWYFGEHALAKQTAEELGLPFHTTEVNYKDHHKWNEEVQFALSGIPHWDRNRTNPRYINIMNAAKNGNKVYIIGDGADELLTGYNGHFRIVENYDWQTTHRLFHMASKDRKYEIIRDTIPHQLFTELDPINNYLFMRGLCEIDSFCTVADSFTGQFGMESRTPFLHQELAKYLLKIPGATKLEVPIRKACKSQRGYANKKHHKWFLLGHYKGIIRDNMKQYLPKHIIDKDRKVGFAHPWDSRDAEKNDVIGLQDWDIMKEQSQKYFSFNVDFKHKLEDNV